MQREKKQIVESKTPSHVTTIAPESLTFPQIARTENISISMVRKMVREGVPVHLGDGVFEQLKLEAHYVGNKPLVRRDRMRAFMARLHNAPPKPTRRRTASAD